MQDDPDPIKASYDVYIKPRISADKQVYVLQFPNRDSKQHYSVANGSAPFKMRIKPNAGMVEMDVPMDALRNYDREKGIKWGEAIKKSNMSKNGGSHGMAGGFGIGGAQAGGRGRGRGQNPDDDSLQRRILDDYENAVKREEVLVRQTLGGQCVSNEDTTPQYMIGTFRKSRLLRSDSLEIAKPFQINSILLQSIILSKCDLSFITLTPIPSKSDLAEQETQQWHPESRKLVQST